ncbi:hypothetical protein GCM10023094_39170 [Rhodococcus olei]|uniref:Uncharacterized protein n=1 Tax=Rhodococcus olei TaxID=2161675 RepID=A0ABP8PDV6_9NOCA
MSGVETLEAARGTEQEQRDRELRLTARRDRATRDRARWSGPASGGPAVIEEDRACNRGIPGGVHLP